jgi:NADH-quinone oxidoreductase subunit N
MTGYALILPELLLLASVLWAMFAEVLPGRDKGAIWVGTLMALGSAGAAVLTPLGSELFGGLLLFDGTARFARTSAALLLALWLLWTAGKGEGRLRESVALASIATIGAMLMSETTELITLVLAIELSTMPAYVLIGYRRWRKPGLEGALKYFLLSMLTTLIMMYGISFVYGITGTTRLSAIDLSGSGTLGLLAVLLAYVGFFAKLSAAPFHYWAPDAYEGAESWAVAFVSTVPKLAGAVAIVRFSAAVAASSTVAKPALVAVAVASMVLGNLAALNQTDVRRMMAYSGVAHTGYLMLAAAALTPDGFGAAVFYAVAYSLPSLGVMLVAAETGWLVDDFNGLAARRPAVAWSGVLMLVSLVGIPPLMGFFGKLYLFTTAFHAGLGIWVVLAVAMSVVSAAYYLRLVRAMFASGAERVAGPVPWSATAAIVLCAALVVGLGLAAGPVLGALGSPIP